MKPPPYAELTCTSNFSFLTGASHPQELVARAAELGYAAIAITDECSLAGVVRALEEARRCAGRDHAIQLIPGSRFRLENGSRLILLPRDHRGYTQICTLVTQGRRNAPKGEYALPDRRFERDLEHCLAIWLPAAPDDYLTANWLTAHFPERCWLGLARDLGPDDARRAAQQVELAHAAGLPVTACGDVRMHRRSRRMLHDVLAAIRHGCAVDELGYRALPSGERHLRPRARLAGLFTAEQMAESAAIAERCAFRLDQLNYRYPREVVPEGKTPAQHLRELVEGFGGGTASGRPVKAVQVGGPLGAYLAADQLDTPMDYEAFVEIDALIGHGGIVVFDDTADMAQQARFAMEFCALESCGKCTPCRIGSTRGVEIIDRIIKGENRDENYDLLVELCDTMEDASLCAMGGMTPYPVRSVLRHFAGEFASENH